jgi:hypothetical protein
VFHVLETSRLLFTDPIAQIPTGTAVSKIPLPLPLHHIRQALTSPDEATALLTAMFAFHGLTTHQVRHLKLSDLHHHLVLEDRHVLLADLVRDRLAAYLDHRHRHWPATHNPQLFIHFRSAYTTAPIGNCWISRRLGPHLTPRTLRDDRLLDEAHVAGGDAKHLMELFGLSTKGAQRYTTTLQHPDLRTGWPGATTETSVPDGP